MCILKVDSPYSRNLHNRVKQLIFKKKKKSVSKKVKEFHLSVILYVCT